MRTGTRTHEKEAGRGVEQRVGDRDLAGTVDTNARRLSIRQKHLASEPRLRSSVRQEDRGVRICVGAGIERCGRHEAIANHDQVPIKTEDPVCRSADGQGGPSDAQHAAVGDAECLENRQRSKSPRAG